VCWYVSGQDSDAMKFDKLIVLCGSLMWHGGLQLVMWDDLMKNGSFMGCDF
jgi:hypothetical protein